MYPDTVKSNRLFLTQRYTGTAFQDSTEINDIISSNPAHKQIEQTHTHTLTELFPMQMQ